jgi:hypothetical protein
MKGTKGYVEARIDRHLDTPTIGRHDDGDFSAVLTIQIEQRGLRGRFPAACRRGVGQSSRDRACVNRTQGSHSHAAIVAGRQRDPDRA